ncbi:plasmid replication initiator TrfA [Paraburkholderia sp. GAS42]|uniref:plasmid replication initiator TrfA n=1 Tax=Paraburkholderia sp. GAS42 TaxID=3035135 RepID=UPI003D22D4BA
MFDLPVQLEICTPGPYELPKELEGIALDSAVLGALQSGKPVAEVLRKFPRAVATSAASEAKLQAAEAGFRDKSMTPGQQLTLGFWPQGFRAAPNELFRCALFNARNRNVRRKYLKDFEVFVIGPGSIRYTGEELRQDDLRVWLQLIELAKASPGEVIRFSAHSFLKEIRWPIKTTSTFKTGKKAGTIVKGSYERLREIITRLQATSLRLVFDRLGSTGEGFSMIPHFRWRDERTKKNLPLYEIRIPIELVKLFGERSKYSTQIEWQQRLDLNDGLATWLHGYFASHREPFPVKLGTLMAGAGLEANRLKHFRQSIRQALKELERVGFLEKGSAINDADLVVVIRTRSNSVQRSPKDA